MSILIKLILLSQIIVPIISSISVTSINHTFCIGTKSFVNKNNICQNATIDTLPMTGISGTLHLYLTSEVWLVESLNFTSHKIKIWGKPSDMASFHCAEEKIAIQFTNISRLELNSFSVRNCQIICECLSATSSVNITGLNVSKSFASGIELININNIFVQSTNFRDNKRQGMKVITHQNASSYSLLIQNCNFTRNNHSGISAYGGGLFINVSTNGSFNLTAENSEFINNTAVYGGGVAIIYSYYSSYIQHNFFNCTFDNNNGTYGGGLYMELAGSPSCFDYSNNGISFEWCNWTANTGIYGSAVMIKSQNVPSFNYNKRQGTKVITHQNASSYSVLIQNCHFTRNNHSDINTYGGGLFINVSNNSAASFDLTVENSTFCSNTAVYGGGVAILYYYYSSYIRHNFLNCKFDNNNGEYGGGLYMILAGSPTCFDNSNNSISFEWCNWTANTGIYGSAMMIKSRNGPNLEHSENTAPRFSSCSFHKNSVIQTYQRLWQKYKVRQSTKGTVYIKNSKILLGGDVRLSENEGSAINLISSHVICLPGTTMLFDSNFAFDGGALALYSESSLRLHNNVSIKFQENSASTKGGAIYQMNDNDIVSPLCAIQERDTNSTQGNRVLTFKNNSAREGGLSIFSSSINLTECSNITMSMACVGDTGKGNIQFSFDSCRNREIETFSQVFSKKGIPHNRSCFVPGKATNLFSNSAINVEYQAVVESMDFEIEVDSAYKTVSNNEIVLLGRPNSTGLLKLLFNGFVLFVEVKLEQCPPGYKYIEKSKACVCSADLPHDDLYQGISRCNKTTFQAYVRDGFWAGYMPNAKFCTSPCPLGFCKYFSSTRKYSILPESFGKEPQDVCGNNREGVLCGRCTNGSSVFFHDSTLSCQKSKNCQWGVLLYISSEILPATIFFVSVIFLDVTFTSGGISGFVFYMQAIDGLRLVNAMWFQRIAQNFLEGLLFIVHFFNLSFFSLEKLSFCLIENATALDMIAFDYITLLYCLVLVLVTIGLITRCSIKLNGCYRPEKLQSSKSFIHGLSSFLVLCYYQCTRISLRLLTYGRVCNSFRVFYNGKILYMQGEHFKYAFPAIVFLILITIIPPVLLLCYPLCYKLLALCHMQESEATKFICKCIPLEKYKPFFDSFQSCFKDEHRYFAGLYFFYRLLLLLSHAFHDDLLNIYLCIEVLLILMLTMHACIRPYKREWHNFIDALLFSLLLLLNSITLFNYNERVVRHHPIDNVGIISSLQVMMAWIPLIVMTLYIIIKGICLVKSFCLSRRRADRNTIFDLSFLLEAEENRDKEYETSYRK